MSVINALVKEVEQESASTIKMLERVPADKFDWKPHEKSMTLKQLATHVAELPITIKIAATTDYLDFAEKSFSKPEINSAQDLVNLYQQSTAAAISALKALKDEDLNLNWIMRSGEQVFFNAPKSVAVRTVALNHFYHHRGQLSVYLRLLNIPLPGVYGPSADEY